MTFFLKQKNRKGNMMKRRGFTLIEMLIAVFIFSLSLASLMAVSSQSMRASRRSQLQVTADYLAIEGIELVHNLRDKAILSKDIGELDWQYVFQGGDDIFDDEGCFDGTGYCNFYTDDSGDPILGNCSKCDVYFDKDNFFYFQVHDEDGMGATKRTPFKRRIRIKSGPESSNEVLVLVEVFWDGGGVSYEDNLFLYQ